MEEKNNNLIIRPPIVVVLGHIDHGKTKLLDTIRKTNVVEEESGGITQHIGAYEIEYKGKKLTFIDTPGHEAFTKLRSRGAKVADIAILVIAADEGVKPQTEESIKIIKKAKIPFIVAINKIDKPEAQPDKVKQQLANLGVFLEGWGGDVPFCEISAKFNKGINELIDLILIMAEMEELRADLNKPASGVVIESYLDSKRGFVATLLIRDGKLKIGDYVCVGNQISRIRVMENFLGKKIKSATFSSPVLVLGFSGLVEVGEKFISSENKNELEEIIKEREKEMILKSKKEEAVLGQEKLEGKKILNVILKSDVFGSKEALDKMVSDLVFQEVAINILKSEIGDVNDSDIKLAQSSNAVIVAFRVDVSLKIELMAKNFNIKIIKSDVIYDLIEKLKLELKTLLEPEIIRYDLGKVNILAVFKTEKNKAIIGGKVVDGEVKKGSLADIVRNKEKIISGKISQLQHNKKDVEIVNQGNECGILFSFSEKDAKESFLKGAFIKIGDILHVYKEEKKEKELV